MPTVAELPHLDEHHVVVAAGVDDLWNALLVSLDESASRRGVAGYARAVGCVPRASAGPRPLAAGSTMPGFRVVAAVPGSELVLQGRHRFSSYALLFRLVDEGPGRSRLRAESRAAFPGITGRAYRLAVVGTGGHVVGMRRLLAGIRGRAEGAA